MIGARPLLAVIDTESDGDGVAHVARLLVRAMAEILESAPPVVKLAPRSFDRVGCREQARFVASLAWAQSSADWVLFGHLGLARAEAWIPSPWRRPFGVILCGIEAWDASMKPGRRRALQDAALRLAISEHTAARTRSAHPTVGPISTCELGLLPQSETGTDGIVDQALIGQLRAASAVIVGRMRASERYKGHDLLLEAWPSVTQAVPEAQLVIVGRGDDVERLRAKSDALGLRDAVLFTGFVSNATRAAILSRARSFVLPSTGEGFGLVYLEAMRAGLPCLGCRGGAAAEIIIDGKTGVLVDPGDTVSVARALASVLANSNLARQMGEAGRRRFQAGYTFDRFRTRLQAVLGDATAKATRPVQSNLSTIQREY